MDKYQSLTGNEYPTLDEFLSKAQDVAARIARKNKNKLIESGNVTDNTPKKLNLNAESTIPSSITTVGFHKPQGGASKKVKKCIFCEDGGHSSCRCPKYTTVLSRITAYNFLHGSDPCNNCLVEHKGKCNPCQNRFCSDQYTHGTLACPLNLNHLRSESVSDSADTKEINVTTNKKNCSVALPTALVQIECGMKDKSLETVGLLFDTAAQQSLIYRDVVKRLNIEPIRQEYTTLVGFGMSKPMARNYDVVRVKLYKTGYPHRVTVTALVVDKPPAICNMAGISSLAKKLSKRGVDIADDRLVNQKRDIITSDLLIGSDYFQNTMYSSRPPQKVLGTYLLNTLWGSAIIGKIQGSTKFSDPQSVTPLSIVHVANGSDDLQGNLHHPGLLTSDGNDIITEFSSFSDIGINLNDREQLDTNAFEHFKKTVKYHDVKQFECGIPWVNGSPTQDLPHNKNVGLKLFHPTMEKLDQNPTKRDHYEDVHTNEVENNFMNKCLSKSLMILIFINIFSFIFLFHPTKHSFTKRVMRVKNLVTP
ncbi:unnamed protein product, partial [Meganyctiphanes norvegica]